jgi:hypothetical protein
MSDPNIDIKKLIDRVNQQDILIKSLIESNQYLNERIDIINKKLRNTNHVLEHNTNIFNRDLTKLEDFTKEINHTIKKRKNINIDKENIS